MNLFGVFSGHLQNFFFRVGLYDTLAFETGIFAMDYLCHFDSPFLGADDVKDVAFVSEGSREALTFVTQ
jgi:hypothetical protein